MAGRLGLQSPPFVYGETNTMLSPDLGEFGAPPYYAPTIYYSTAMPLKNSSAHVPRMPKANNYGIVARPSQSFFNDFYFRVHIQPISIDLGTVASPQTRNIGVWNAWPDTNANLTSLVLTNSAGITINGPALPFSMNPLQTATYAITVGTNGPAKVDVYATFDFSNVPDPLPLYIKGTRAVKFEIVPEVPINENWDWLTDIQTANDGTEQRISLRGENPRVTQSFKAVFTSSAEIRKFYNSLAVSVGRLWIPEYQYATPLTAASAAGALTVNFDRGRTDVRAGEYGLIIAGANSALIELATLESYGATLSAPLEFAVPAGSLFVPGSSAFLDENTGLERHAVNEVAEVSLNCKFNRYRATLTRPGSTVTLPTFLGDAVCDKRPLANELVNDAVSTGQTLVDNQTGVLDLVSDWDYSRIGGARTFKVDRARDPVQMDYWKAVLGNARGQARKFWMPTYRDDLLIAATPADGANVLTVSGLDYAQRTYNLPTHRYVELETAAGIHRASVTSATEVSANTQIGISPQLPAGIGWTQIKRISYLLPVRLAEDRATWKHYGLESLLTFSIRTAEP